MPIRRARALTGTALSGSRRWGEGPGRRGSTVSTTDFLPQSTPRSVIVSGPLVDKQECLSLPGSAARSGPSAERNQRRVRCDTSRKTAGLRTPMKPRERGL